MSILGTLKIVQGGFYGFFRTQRHPRSFLSSQSVVPGCTYWVPKYSQRLIKVYTNIYYKWEYLCFVYMLIYGIVTQISIYCTYIPMCQRSQVCMYRLDHSFFHFDRFLGTPFCSLLVLVVISTSLGTSSVCQYVHSLVRCLQLPKKHYRINL